MCKISNTHRCREKTNKPQEPLPSFNIRILLVLFNQSACHPCTYCFGDYFKTHCRQTDHFIHKYFFVHLLMYKGVCMCIYFQWDHVRLRSEKSRIYYHNSTKEGNAEGLACTKSCFLKGMFWEWGTKTRLMWLGEFQKEGSQYKIEKNIGLDHTEDFETILVVMLLI